MHRELQNGQISEQIRTICIQSAIEAYEEAGVKGLCQEGRWALAVDAMKHVNLEHFADLLCVRSSNR
jgi:hypothetical protein